MKFRVTIVTEYELDEGDKIDELMELAQCLSDARERLIEVGEVTLVEIETIPAKKVGVK